MEARGELVESISAVTLLIADMAVAVAFYRSLAFHLLYGGEETPFTSFGWAPATSIFSSTQPVRPVGAVG